jgi:hypothetical protein
MNNPLSIVSILLAVFYLMWFAWEQNGVIFEQEIYIKELEKELFARKLILGEFNHVFENKEDDTSPIHKPSI